MIENVNSSYETLIKRFQKIWQQSQANSESIKNSQPDNSKINLEPNWLQSTAIISDTRNADGTDQTVHPITYDTDIPDVIKSNNPVFPINYNITSGLMPMTVSYNYKNILPNVTKDIIPFLEYQTSFSVPTGNMTLVSGFLWNVDAWVSTFIVTANGQTIWEGYDPPPGDDIEISQYQVDNNYATYYQQSYQLTFTSSSGGIYGNGNTVNIILLSIFDATDSVFVPLSDDAISNFIVGHLYEFYTWSNPEQASFVIEYSLLTTASITIKTGLYVSFWEGGYGTNTETPFYIFQNVISGGNIIYELFPPTDHILTPIIFTINDTPPVKYSDIIGQTFSTYVPSNPTYDPFYVRQSKSTDLDESWQSNVTFAAVVVSQGVQTTGASLAKYNDVYNLTSGGSWTPTYSHTTINTDQFLPIEYDMTARVRVAVRPIINWKKTDKYQV